MVPFAVVCGGHLRLWCRGGRLGQFPIPSQELDPAEPELDPGEQGEFEPDELSDPDSREPDPSEPVLVEPDDPALGVQAGSVFSSSRTVTVLLVRLVM